MPNWGDDEGRYWWKDPGTREEVQIPHPPVTERKGCRCAMCSHGRKERAKARLAARGIVSRDCRACGHSRKEVQEPKLVCGHPDAGEYGTYAEKASAKGGHCGPGTPKFVQHPLRSPEGEYMEPATMRALEWEFRSAFAWDFVGPLLDALGMEHEADLEKEVVWSRSTFWVSAKWRRRTFYKGLRQGEDGRHEGGWVDEAGKPPPEGSSEASASLAELARARGWACAESAGTVSGGTGREEMVGKVRTFSGTAFTADCRWGIRVRMVDAGQISLRFVAGSPEEAVERMAAHAAARAARASSSVPA